MGQPNPGYKGHKPTLSSVSNTFSDISCMTDISEVSYQSEDEITVTEVCQDEKQDSIGLKSLANHPPTDGSDSDNDDKVDNKAVLDTPVEVTKDGDLINKVRSASVGLGPASLINPPITEHIVGGTIVNNSEIDKKRIFEMEREIPELEKSKTVIDKSLGRR